MTAAVKPDQVKRRRVYLGGSPPNHDGEDGDCGEAGDWLRARWDTGEVSDYRASVCERESCRISFGNSKNVFGHHNSGNIRTIQLIRLTIDSASVCRNVDEGAELPAFPVVTCNGMSSTLHLPYSSLVFRVPSS